MWCSSGRPRRPGPGSSVTSRGFEAFQPRLEAVAYRLLGSAGEAEEAVQETFLRGQAADVDRIEVPRPG
jgi:DNA-directed RNA polymerase specialized sigma24 family protein